MLASAKAFRIILLALACMSSYAQTSIRYVCIDPKTMARVAVQSTSCPSKFIESRQYPDPSAGSGWSENPAQPTPNSEPPKSVPSGQSAILEAGVKGVIQWFVVVLFVVIAWRTVKFLAFTLKSVSSNSRQALKIAKRLAVESPLGTASSIHSGADDELFAMALDELDAKKPDRACWARALAVSDGDEVKARGTYIKFRVASLKR